MTRAPYDHLPDGSPARGICWGTALTVAALIVAYFVAGVLG